MPHQPFVRTLRAQWLGNQLRQLRVERGLTLKLVATHLHRDMSALGRYERAEWPIGRADVVSLLDLYGFHDAKARARLLALAEEVWRTDRWDEEYGDVVDASFIDETALRRRVGGSEVMRAQLLHLLELAKRPTIELRVLDSKQTVNPGVHGPFTVFAMPDPYPAVAYVENLAGRLYVEMPKAEKFVRAYDALLKAALDPRESVRLIAAVAEELS